MTAFVNFVNFSSVYRVNVPVVDISLQNKFESSDDERERQLQIENFDDKEIWKKGDVSFSAITCTVMKK